MARPTLCFSASRKSRSSEVEQHEPHEQLEVAWVGEVDDAHPRAEEHSGERADDHRPGERPDHAPLANVAVHAARDRHDVEELVRGADRGRGVAEEAHLERQQQERAGDPAHGGEEGDDQGDERRKPEGGVDPGYREVHACSCAAAGDGPAPSYHALMGMEVGIGEAA